MDQDVLDYQHLQEGQAKEWEARCRSCGMCCGVKDGDPCEDLVAQKDGKYFCRVYKTRFGLHKTKSGREFPCVPIRDILHETWPGDGMCAYKGIWKKL